VVRFSHDSLTWPVGKTTPLLCAREKLSAFARNFVLSARCCAHRVRWNSFKNRTEPIKPGPRRHRRERPTDAGEGKRFLSSGNDFGLRPRRSTDSPAKGVRSRVRSSESPLTYLRDALVANANEPFDFDAPSRTFVVQRGRGLTPVNEREFTRFDTLCRTSGEGLELRI